MFVSENRFTRKNTGTASMKGEKMKRILIVDDDEDICALCENELTDEGYFTRSVSSGTEALRFVDENPDIDLIVLDIKMSPLDGIEVLERLRQKNITVPVILYSGYSTYRNNFEAWFADAYLVKQPDLSELKATVRGFLISKRN